MRRPPPLQEFLHYPIVGGTIALAIAVTLARWSGRVNVDALYETVDIRRGELWRLLTSALPHANALHLGFNCYWIWVFGTLIEKSFGPARTFAILILLAVVANGAEYALLTGGMGLSGVGYGLFGLIWALARHDARFEDAIDQNTITLFVGWFFFCILLTYMGYPIGNVAHGMGAVAGVLLGWAISNATQQRLAASGALALLVLGVLGGAVFARPWINLSSEGGIGEGRLGYELLLADHNEDALHWLRDATRMEPRNAGYWYNLAIADDRLNRQVEAVAAFQRAHDLDPTNDKYTSAWQESKSTAH